MEKQTISLDMDTTNTVFLVYFYRLKEGDYIIKDIFKYCLFISIDCSETVAKVVILAAMSCLIHICKFR